MTKIVKPPVSVPPTSSSSVHPHKRRQGRIDSLKFFEWLKQAQQNPQTLEENQIRVLEGSLSNITLSRNSTR